MRADTPAYRLAAWDTRTTSSLAQRGTSNATVTRPTRIANARPHRIARPNHTRRRGRRRCRAHDVANPNTDLTCAFKKITNAWTQHTSQIIPPDMPVVRNRAWSASLPQNEQWRGFHSTLPGSGRVGGHDSSSRVGGVHPAMRGLTQLVQAAPNLSDHLLGCGSVIFAANQNIGTPRTGRTAPPHSTSVGAVQTGTPGTRQGGGASYTSVSVCFVAPCTAPISAQTAL